MAHNDDPWTIEDTLYSILAVALILFPPLICVWLLANSV